MKPEVWKDGLLSPSVASRVAASLRFNAATGDVYAVATGESSEGVKAMETEETKEATGGGGKGGPVVVPLAQSLIDSSHRRFLTSLQRRGVVQRIPSSGVPSSDGGKGGKGGKRGHLADSVVFPKAKKLAGMCEDRDRERERQRQTGRQTDRER